LHYINHILHYITLHYISSYGMTWHVTYTHVQNVNNNMINMTSCFDSFITCCRLWSQMVAPSIPGKGKPQTESTLGVPSEAVSPQLQPTMYIYIYINIYIQDSTSRKTLKIMSTCLIFSISQKRITNDWFFTCQISIISSFHRALEVSDDSSNLSFEVKLRVKLGWNGRMVSCPQVKLEGGRCILIKCHNHFGENKHGRQKYTKIGSTDRHWIH